MPATRKDYFIERPVTEYSVRALVYGLRNEVRISWRVMHVLRKNAAAEADQDTRTRIEYAADRLKKNLTDTLAILNEGLGRQGSYYPTCMRRLRQRNAELTARLGMTLHD